MDTDRKNSENDLTDNQLEDRKNARKCRLFLEIVGLVNVSIKYAAIVIIIIAGIRSIIPNPVDNINALGDNFIKVIIVYFEYINKDNWIVNLVDFLLVILVALLYFRNRSLTKELGKCRKEVERNDSYRSSSNLDKYGEKRIGEE